MRADFTVAMIHEKFNALSALMDERVRRRWAAAEASSRGRGGITLVARATGLSRMTIQAGLAELADPTSDAEASRIRRKGAGRPRLRQQDARLLSDLKVLLEPATRGDPRSPLLWT